LTIDYLKYETVIDLKLIALKSGEHLDSNPAISFCLKPSSFYSGINETSSIIDSIGEISCRMFTSMTDVSSNIVNFVFFFELTNFKTWKNQ